MLEIPNHPLELKKIFKIIALYEGKLGIRATMKRTGISKRTIQKYRRLYEKVKEDLFYEIGLSGGRNAE